MSGSWSPGSLWARLAAAFRSMKVRVFLAAFVVALVPLATMVGWGLLWQKEVIDQQWQDARTRNAEVHSAWDRLGAGEPATEWSGEDDLTTMMRSLAGMQTELSRADYEGLLGRVAALMNTSRGNYVMMKVKPQELSAPAGPFAEHPQALAQLRARAYWWGDATYSWTDVASDSSSSSDGFSTMGEDTPTVAWMPSADQAWYVQVTSAYQNPPHGEPTWWIAAVIGVMLAIIAGLAVLAALLATRGVAKPLKGMAAASDRLAEDVAAEPVPVRGPSEVRCAARAFNAMAARLTKAQDTEQQFLLSVSHELKTPLTSIKGYGEALAEGAVSAAEAGPVVADEAGRMQRLVQDLLDLGRVRKSSFGVRHEAVRLDEVVREAVRRYEPLAETCKVELRTAVPAEGSPADGQTVALADADRVLQVVSNLVENAVRCAPAFSDVTVITGVADRAKADRDEVYVRVADSGLGLQDEELEHAFDRFYLYERYGRERQVGSGLGLAIVKELTEAMGGRVEVAARPGSGTTFTVSLPRSSAGEPDPS